MLNVHRRLASDVMAAVLRELKQKNFIIFFCIWHQHGRPTFISGTSSDCFGSHDLNIVDLVKIVFSDRYLSLPPDRIKPTTYQ